MLTHVGAGWAPVIYTEQGGAHVQERKVNLGD